jgi:hypothetical protein
VFVPPDRERSAGKITALDAVSTLVYPIVYFINRQRWEYGAMKWELDLWYELWDRAGSQGLDTWYELRNEVRDGPAAGRTPDAEGSDEIQDRPPEGV